MKEQFVRDFVIAYMAQGQFEMRMKGTEFSDMEYLAIAAQRAAILSYEAIDSVASISEGEIDWLGQSRNWRRK